MTTFSASFSAARAAVLRACSRAVRAFSVPRGSATSIGPVQPVLVDVGGNRRRDEPVHRLAPREAGADDRRRDVVRRELEALDPVGVLVEVVAGARGDAEARQLEDTLGLLPGREVGELIGTDQEDRVVIGAGLELVDGEGVGLELDRRVGGRRRRAASSRAGARRGPARACVPRPRPPTRAGRRSPKCFTAASASAT